MARFYWNPKRWWNVQSIFMVRLFHHQLLPPPPSSSKEKLISESENSQGSFSIALGSVAEVVVVVCCLFCLLFWPPLFTFLRAKMLFATTLPLSASNVTSILFGPKSRVIFVIIFPVDGASCVSTRRFPDEAFGCSKITSTCLPSMVTSDIFWPRKKLISWLLKAVSVLMVHIAGQSSPCKNKINLTFYAPKCFKLSSHVQEMQRSLVLPTKSKQFEPCLPLPIYQLKPC